MVYGGSRGDEGHHVGAFMPGDFEKQIGQFIEREKLFAPGQKALLAVSGGADSTALIHVLSALQRTGVPANTFHCAHLNHELRGRQAERDEQFVVEKASELGIEMTVERRDVLRMARAEGLSIETAARNWRIARLTAIAKEHGCSAVVTGHHKDDNAETLVQRLARGTAMRGLAGMRPAQSFGAGVTFVRPLLCVGRHQILSYLEERGLQWCVDHTNRDCRFRRNHIRHRLIPVLQRECDRPIADLLEELASVARRLGERVERRVERIWASVAIFTKDGMALDTAVTAGESPLIQVELFRRALRHIGCGERRITEDHYKRLLRLAQETDTGKTVEMPGEFIVQRTYDGLLFRRLGDSFDSHTLSDEEPVELTVPGVTQFDTFGIETRIIDSVASNQEVLCAKRQSVNGVSYCETFDLDKVRLPLTVRGRRRGDRFVPLGMQSAKKVGKFLTAAKVAHSVRDRIAILSDNEKVIWVCPVRMSESVRVSEDTRRLLQVSVYDGGAEKG